MTTKTRGWPPARRAAQAARCRATRPWLYSTGPRTAAGKARSSRNAYRHGFRTAAFDGIRALLRWQKYVVKAMVARNALPSFPKFNFHELTRPAPLAWPMANRPRYPHPVFARGLASGYNPL